MPSKADLHQFLAQTLPWPDDGSGYINLHWTTPNPKNAKRPFFNGKPTQEIEEFLGLAAWLQSKTDVRDLYMCMSRQAVHILGKTGKPKAVRDQRNAKALASFYFDLDGKDYGSKQAALLAFQQFLRETCLPFPSIVDSGGGFHIYWSIKQRLSREDWQPYAEGFKELAVKHGLKLDYGVTVDSARVLRVPGTYNFKQAEKRPVVLLHVGEVSDISRFDFLRVTAAPKPTGLAKLAYDAIKFEGAVPMVTGPAQPRLKVASELQVGPILESCEFLRTAVETGGKDYDQPQWNLTTLCATFLPDGHKLAHDMGKQHETYTEEDTDKLFARKLKETKEKGVGWPSCQAIADAGSAACLRCPLFAERKSPLHLGLPAKKETYVPDQEAADALALPADATLIDGKICWREVSPKGVELWRPLFFSTISNPWAQRKPYPGLNFTTSVDMQNFGRVCIKQDDMGDGPLTAALRAAEVKYHPTYKKYLEVFFMAWLDRLHSIQEASKVDAFGWYMPNNVDYEGFCYGGLLFTPDGKSQIAGYAGKNIADNYEPMGKIEPWFDAMRLTTNQKRPDLELLLIASFASALVRSAAQSSVCLAGVGLSGSGKSSAIETGISVWSHPKLTKSHVLSTVKAMLDKAGIIRALPLYKDDILDEKDLDYFISQMFLQTQGVDPERLNSNITHQARKTWNSMFTVTSNSSFAERVMIKQPNHDAGLKRLFEYDIPVYHKDADGNISSLDAGLILQKLEGNYGQMGLLYAKYLATNIEKVKKLTYDEGRWFEEKMNADRTERFWVSMCGALVAAGNIANELGCEFHMKENKEFLLEQYARQRERVHVEAVVYTAPKQLFNRFIDDHDKNQLWTNGGQQKHFTGVPRRGRPLAVNTVSAPRPGDPVFIHWDQTSKNVRVKKARFLDWLIFKKMSPKKVLRDLEKEFKVSYPRQMLGAGSTHPSGQEALIQIEVPFPSHDLWEILMRHTDTHSYDDSPQVADNSEGTTEDTGPKVAAGGTG